MSSFNKKTNIISNYIEQKYAIFVLPNFKEKQISTLYFIISMIMSLCIK